MTQPNVGNIVLYNSLYGKITCIVSNVYDLNNQYSDVSLHIFNNSLREAQYKYIDRVSYGVGTLYCWEWPDNNIPALLTGFLKNISNASNGDVIIYNENIGAWQSYSPMHPDAPNPTNNPGISIDSGFF